MRVMIVHNYYQQPGGEDAVVHEETQLLRSRGHEVHTFFRHNDAVDAMNRLSLAGSTLWNSRIAHELHQALLRHRCEVVHFHNTFPLISPAAYGAARRAGAAVVQTLHNYRLACVNGLLFREGRPCEDCVGAAVAWRGVARKCYRDDRQASAVVAAMTAGHRLLGTWRRAVDRYIAVSAFCRDMLVRSGLPAERIVVKANHVAPDPGAGSGAGGYVAFVGRLSKEKGLTTLLGAAAASRGDWRLKVLGQGPMMAELQAAAAADPRIEVLGHQTRQQVMAVLRDAVALVFPSASYETMGNVVAEAYACGTPVLASDHGPMRQMVEEGVTGLRFPPLDHARLARLLDLTATGPQAFAAMRASARQRFEQHFHEDVAYDTLLRIYLEACDARRATRRRTWAAPAPREGRAA